MVHASTRPRPAAAVGLTVAGGTLLAVGTLLVWFRAPGSEANTVRGVEMFVGKATLALGVLVAVCGGLILVLDSRAGRGAASGVGLLLAVVAALLTLYSAYAPLDAFAQFAAAEADQGQATADQIEQALHDSGIVISSGLGAWLSAAGSVTAIAGTAAGIVAATRLPRAGQGRTGTSGIRRTRGA